VLNYRRVDALRTRRIVRNALIDVIEKGRHHSTEWNVKVVLQSAQRKRPPAKRHRRVRFKARGRQVVDSE
jgi:hypothetical protein